MILWTIFQSFVDISTFKKCNLTNVRLPISISDLLSAVADVFYRSGQNSDFTRPIDVNINSKFV